MDGAVKETEALFEGKCMKTGITSGCYYSGGKAADEIGSFIRKGQRLTAAMEDCFRAQLAADTFQLGLLSRSFWGGGKWAKLTQTARNEAEKAKTTAINSLLSRFDRLVQLGRDKFRAYAGESCRNEENTFATLDLWSKRWVASERRKFSKLVPKAKDVAQVEEDQIPPTSSAPTAAAVVANRATIPEVCKPVEFL